IWVTDEPYPENIQKREPLINSLLAQGVTVHGIGPLELQTDWFNPIVLATGGNFYDIRSNFRDILLDVARMESNNRYLISYTSRISRSELKLLAVQVRWAGLGGQAQYTIGQGPGGGLLACRPNPFNPTVTLSVGVPNRRGLIEIFDLRGRLIRTFDVTPNGPTEWVWDAADAQGNIVSSGVYFVRLSLESPYGVERHQQRIVFLK
ncbi:MAG: hypothetical protein ONB12_06455, partial [candidate division KSB1 bacterium]|nr:hypothetical protein [candidate division KSB1 bacterium]